MIFKYCHISNSIFTDTKIMLIIDNKSLKTEEILYS